MKNDFDWTKALSFHRLGRRSRDLATPGRSPFQQDFDRVVFSSAFRRLQDKAQVFPLADHDYVRTRLTHSIETASIGRSLGGGVGAYICDKFHPEGLAPNDFGAAVAAACLAHDIGNPPLGHAGEEAIRSWFATSPVAARLAKHLTPEECADFSHYEGNAQGFRVLARLESPFNPGGMQLTCATLAALCKYPSSAAARGTLPGAEGRKFNFFRQDMALFEEVAEATGMIRVSDETWHRHPLAQLVEAADDITYLIVDFEDAHKLKIISYSELESLFMPMISDGALERAVRAIPDDSQKVELLRAKVLGVLVRQCGRAFIDYYDEIVSGELDRPLSSLIEAAPLLQQIKARSAGRIYNFQRAVEIQAAGFELTSGLLDTFMLAVADGSADARGESPLSYRSRKMLCLLPSRFRDFEDPEFCRDTYGQMLSVLDYITSLTDTHAVTLFRRLKGISLPGMEG